MNKLQSLLAEAGIDKTRKTHKLITSHLVISPFHATRRRKSREFGRGKRLMMPWRKRHKLPRQGRSVLVDVSTVMAPRKSIESRNGIIISTILIWGRSMTVPSMIPRLLIE